MFRQITKLQVCSPMDLNSLDVGIKNLCTVRFNAKRVPQEAIERLWSREGSYHYYKVRFEVCICFSTTLQFKVMYKGKILGVGEASYN